MGFFKGLKEDIVQSVNELSDSLGDVLEEDETVTTIENPEPVSYTHLYVDWLML